MPSAKDAVDGWNEWSKAVLGKLEEHERKLDAIHKTLTRIEVELAVVKVKSGYWGAIGVAGGIFITVFGMWMKAKI